MDEDQRPKVSTTVSIILPVANECAVIRETLRHLTSLGSNGVIVVDGASDDGTDRIIREEFPGVMFLQAGTPNRALQLNVGAARARCDALLFVHADMRMPQNTVRLVGERIQAGFAGGGFRKRYQPSTPLLDLYGLCLNLFYLELARALVATNGMFVKRTVFEKMHGFPQDGFMEDVIFSEGLKAQGRVAVIPEPVTVSSRRYFRQGTVRQIAKNAEILFRYRFLRQHPVSLRKIYERRK